MMLSVGVKRYESHTATYNGDAVQLLLDAGAIIIAITSTPPYSAWIETSNSIIGYTNNPYDTRKTSGGSSGGEVSISKHLRFQKKLFIQKFQQIKLS